MNTNEYITKSIKESVETKSLILNDDFILQQIDKACDIIVKAYHSGKKTIFAGNGGSAADAQHLAGELVSRFMFDRPGLASLALTTDTSILTAIGNDYGYNRLFSRQLESNAQAGDVFIGISTSGNSPNIIEALKTCREKGIYSIGLTGSNTDSAIGQADLCIRVPSKITPRIQECHILIGHIICGIVEEIMFSSFRK